MANRVAKPVKKLVSKKPIQLTQSFRSADDLRAAMRVQQSGVGKVGKLITIK